MVKTSQLSLDLQGFNIPDFDNFGGATEEWVVGRGEGAYWVLVRLNHANFLETWQNIPYLRQNILKLISRIHQKGIWLIIAHNDGVILRAAKESITEDADGENDALVTFEGLNTLVRRARVPDLHVMSEKYTTSSNTNVRNDF